MKAASPWLLTGTALGAFALAFGMARFWTPTPAARDGSLPILSDATAGGSPPADGTHARDEAEEPTGVLRDDILREALASPTLLDAVRLVMAREQEDHCADTRLVCLVELWPAERLAEVAAVLETHAANDFIIRFVLGAWSERDPATARAWVEKHPLNASGEKAFLAGWTRAEPDAALAWLDRQPASQATNRRRAAYLEALSETNLAAAWEILKTREWLGTNPAALVSLAHQWAGRDPAGALTAMREMIAHLGIASQPSGEGGWNQMLRVLLGAVLSGTFNREPAAAVALVSQLAPEEIKTGADAIAKEILSRDPTTAEAVLRVIPPEQLEALFQSFGTQAPDLFPALWSHLTDDSLKVRLLENSLKANPLEASPHAFRSLDRAELGRVIDAVTDTTQRERLNARAAATMAGIDPAWALQRWQHVGESQRKRYYESMLAGLARTDAEQALAFYENSPDQWRSKNLKLLCYTLGQTKPEAALAVLWRETSPQTQTAAAASLFAAWVARDATAAFTALEQEAPQLDVPGMLEALPTATKFDYRGGFMSHYLDTNDLAAKLRALGAGSEGTPPP